MSKKCVLIEDSTLREGEQSPGVAFTEAQKRSIVQALAQAGVKHIEVGTPAMRSVEFMTIKALAQDLSDLTLIGWNRGVRADLDKTFESGLTALHIGLPSSDLHIKEKFGRDKNWVLDTAADLVTYAKSQGAKFISVSAEDIGRADLEFLKKYARTIQSAGASRMRLSDTIGCLTPHRVAEIVTTLKQTVDIDLQLHMHNDLNLSLANVLSGVEAGATQVHVTINGLGERAGIAALHQVAVALHLLLDVETGIDLRQLVSLSELVAVYTKHPIAFNEPIIGKNVFTHESGIHVDGILKVKESFEPFPPELVDRQHQFVLGKHSGSHALEHILKEAGVKIDREQARTLIPLIRRVSCVLGGCVPEPLAVVMAEHILNDSAK